MEEAGPMKFAGNDTGTGATTAGRTGAATGAML